MRVERFCTVEGESPHLDEDGFLIDRWRFPLSQPLTPGLVPLADVCAQSAVLLGEAGAGKTYALRAVMQDLTAEQRTNATPSDSAHACVDLGEVRSWEDLVRKARPALNRLIPRVSAPTAPPEPAPQPSERVLLILDGVDECKATPKQRAGWLTELANSYHCEQLQVLIGCRSMAYTDVLRRAVEKAFGITRAHVLAPLRRSDLDTAAHARGLEPGEFAAAVSAAGASALARMPLTLSFLLDLYQARGRLPTSRVELYDRALPQLVMRQGEDRDPAELVGSQTQRFAVATRLACYCLLTGASAVHTTRQPSGEDHLAVDDFIGGCEGTPHGSFTIDRLIVQSVLSSPLFTGRGVGAAGPVHASIASYLAARYLADHRLPEAQLRGLLIQRGEVGDPGIRGDLQEMAAWLIALRPELGPWLIQAHPEAIAPYSAYIDDPASHRLIVDQLLNLARSGNLNGNPWRYGHRYRLKYPGLAERLRPALRRATDTSPAEAPAPPGLAEELELALALTAYNDQTDLLPDVIEIATDDQRPTDLRRLAVTVASNLDPAAAGPLLKPVLAELAAYPDRDPVDGLRGAVLQVCWPQHLEVSELIAALTPPRRPGFSGMYDRFCRSLPTRLAEGDVLPLIDWAGQVLTSPAEEPGNAEQRPTSAGAGWPHAKDMTQGLLDRAMDGPSAADRIPAVARPAY